MSYEIIRQPFMLMETVSMLYKYVNGVSFQSALDRVKMSAGDRAFDAMCRRAGWLQEILFKVCKDLNPADPVLRKYFGKVELGYATGCLAQFMTHLTCVTAKYPDYWQDVEGLCKLWRMLREQGYRIDPGSTNGFSFIKDPDGTTDLFTQIKVLNLPPEFRLELYEAMKDYEKNLRALATLMEPLAIKLEDCYRQEQWLLDETVAHWEAEFKKIHPLEFVADFTGEANIAGASEKTRVAVSLMNSNQIIIGMANEPYLQGEYNVIFVGSCMTTDSVPSKRGGDLGHLSAALKCLGDRKRLEILQRLSKGQGYGLELAESMGVDSGNMSRTLTQLHHYGFLQQERGTLRNYYQTDRTAVREFLKLVETTILGDE